MDTKHPIPILSAMAGALLLSLACGTTPRDTEVVPAEGEASSPPIADSASNVALLRVVNAVPGEPATDVMVADHVAFSGIAYGAVTAYREFTASPVTFRVRPSVPENATPVVETTDRLNAGKHYTLLAMPGDPGGVELALLVDEVAPPADGKAALRVMNASPEPGTVDVDVKDSARTLVSGPGSSPASGFVDVAPVNGTLVIRRARAVLARVPEARLEAGRRYTVLLLGATQSPAGGHEARLIDEPYPGSPQS
jgi:Domain of unknown function (DUF4397)